MASGDAERVDYECISRPQVSKAAAHEARIFAAKRAQQGLKVQSKGAATMEASGQS